VGGAPSNGEGKKRDSITNRMESKPIWGEKKRNLLGPHFLSHILHRESPILVLERKREGKRTLRQTRKEEKVWLSL